MKRAFLAAGVRKMARKSTWSEKLHNSKGLPKIVEITGRIARSWGEGSCVVPAPIEVDHLMRQVKRGQLITGLELRQALAAFHDTDMACPLTTGIFCWIAAHAAAEAEERGERRTTPWWRTLKTEGELNPKYPGCLERQRTLLEAEGHVVIAKGKRLFVSAHERRIAKLEPATLSSCLADVTTWWPADATTASHRVSNVPLSSVNASSHAELRSQASQQ